MDGERGRKQKILRKREKGCEGMEKEKDGNKERMEIGGGLGGDEDRLWIGEKEEDKYTLWEKKRREESNGVEERVMRRKGKECKLIMKGMGEKDDRVEGGDGRKGKILGDNDEMKKKRRKE